MEVIEIFQVLGIEATKDERAIKNAYREKLSVTNPEDNPEGFKRLRTAYEEACIYAKQSEEEVGTLGEEDDSPSGLWVKKAELLYKNIITRQDVEKWKALFEEDVFLSLEEEENCRFKLLRFMMDNFKFPTAIWKLFDEKMNLKADGQKLRETFPGDFISYVLARCERGDDIEYSQFEGDPEAEYDLYLQYYDRCWNALQEKQFEQAEEYIKNADDLQIFHPIMEVCRAYLYVEQGKVDEAISDLKKLRERYPVDAMICYNAAEIMWQHNKKEDAAEVYTALKEANEKHYMANMRLTEWNYENGRYEEAKKCAEKVLSHGADDEFMELLAKVNAEIEKGFEEHYEREKDVHSALELGWCYLQDGKVAKGIGLVESVKESEVPLDRVSEYRGLLTKLYMEETEFEKAYEMAKGWDDALKERLLSDESEEEKEKDRDRIRQKHLIHMQCHRAFGDMRSTREPEDCRLDYEKAIAEIDDLLEGNSRDIGLLLEKAQIYMEMEEFEKSLDVTRSLIEEYQVYAAYATEVEVYRRQWDAGGVVQAARQCINYFPNYTRAYEHMAKVFLDLKRPDDLESILQEAKENNVESCILDAYRYQKDHEVPETDVLDTKLEEFRKKYFTGVENGDMKYYEEGLPIITEYLYWYPGTYMLVERGLFHRTARHYEEAKADFEKALAENPRQPYALNGLSFVYKYMGEYEQALMCAKRAERYRDPDMSDVIFADMANLYSLMGMHEEAYKYYKRFTDGSHKGTYHMKKLAACMARVGNINGAVNVLNHELKDQPQERFYALVDLYESAGMEAETEKALAEWNQYLLTVTQSDSIKRAEDMSDYYVHRAWQDILFGKGEKAVEFYNIAIQRTIEAKLASSILADRMADAVFVCILCKEDGKGRVWAQKLHTLIQSSRRSGKIWENEGKTLARQEFLAHYYDKSWEAEDMKTPLELGDKCEVCRGCNKCVCKELEGAWILYLLRAGKTEEAWKRLKSNLEKLYLDEYMRVCLNMCRSQFVGVAGEEAVQALEREIHNKVSQSPVIQNQTTNIEEDAKKEPVAQEKTGLLGKIKGMFGKK